MSERTSLHRAAHVLLSCLAGVAILVPFLPGTQLSVAEGCSGAGPVCKGPGWASIELHASAASVPTDSGVLVVAKSDTLSCVGSPSDVSLWAVAVDPATSATTTGTMKMLSATLVGGRLVRTFLWWPSTPLSPSTAYTLEVDAGGPVGSGGGGSGGGGSAGGSKTLLAFTVGSAALSLPALHVTNATQAIRNNVQLCCSNGNCGSKCKTIVEKETRQVSLTIAPAAANPAYVSYEVDQLDEGGAGASVLARFAGWATPGPYEVKSTKYDVGTPCLRVRALLLGSSAVLSSEVFCPAEVPLVTPVVHCDQIPVILAECKGFSVNPTLAESQAKTLTSQYCGQSGAGGDPATGAAGATASGTGGTTAAGDGAPAPGASPPGDDNAGCHIAAGRPAGLFGFFVLASALGAMGRRRVKR